MLMNQQRMKLQRLRNTNRDDDVTGAVTIPDYPSDKEQPTIKVDDPSKLPDGNTPGTSNVDVT